MVLIDSVGVIIISNNILVVGSQEKIQFQNNPFALSLKKSLRID